MICCSTHARTPNHPPTPTQEPPEPEPEPTPEPRPEPRPPLSQCTAGVPMSSFYIYSKILHFWFSKENTGHFAIFTNGLS